MKKRLRTARRNGLRIFLITIVVVTWLVFALLAGGMMFATFNLHRQNVKLEKENQDLQTTVMLELEILALGREAKISKTLTPADFIAADEYQQQLVHNADTQQKQSLTLEIVRQYGEFQKNALAGIKERGIELNYALYSDLESLRVINKQQLDATRLTAQRINMLAQGWGIGLLVLAGLFLTWGSVELWLRIFNPIIALSRTARAIANGHMNVRAPVLRDDELGALSNTFNVMADAMVEREKDRMHFVATVAHDLKNPLVVIGGLAHLLGHKKTAVTPQENREWLELIVQNTRKLEELIAELTDATQAATGKIPLSLQEVDLAELVATLIKQRASYEKTHRFTSEIGAVPKIQGDVQKLERVVMNVLSNAIKYSAPGTLITVRLHNDKRWVKLHVTDQGAGMSHLDLKKIFIPFLRLEHTQDMAPGTGLGLLSVKKIVEAHGGKIRLHSELNKGTRVVLLFPHIRKRKNVSREA